MLHLFAPKKGQTQSESGCEGFGVLERAHAHMSASMQHAAPLAENSPFSHFRKSRGKVCPLCRLGRSAQGPGSNTDDTDCGLDEKSAGRTGNAATSKRGLLCVPGSMFVQGLCQLDMQRQAAWWFLLSSSREPSTHHSSRGRRATLSRPVAEALRLLCGGGVPRVGTKATDP